MSVNPEVVTVNGKQRRSFTKYGKKFVRCFVDVEVTEADKFSKKCDYFAKDDSDVIRELIKGFNMSFGFPNNPEVKDPGSLFEVRAREHILDAVKKAVKEVAGCQFSEN